MLIVIGCSLQASFSFSHGLTTSSLGAALETLESKLCFCVFPFCFHEDLFQFDIKCECKQPTEERTMLIFSSSDHEDTLRDCHSWDCGFEIFFVSADFCFGLHVDCMHASLRPDRKSVV